MTKVRESSGDEFPAGGSGFSSKCGEENEEEYCYRMSESEITRSWKCKDVMMLTIA